MIPTARDVRALVGDFGELVDNRSLLYEKFALPKVWGQANGGKLDEAARWNVLRIVTRGSDLLKKDADNLDHRAARRNVQPYKAERMRHAATVARKLASVGRPDASLARACAANAKRLLADLEHAFPARVVTFEATLGGRLLVNMAGGVIENAGICLDRCFGLPLLPGSAVKGIARAQALWEVQEAKGAGKEQLLRLAMLLFGYGAHDLRGEGDFAWAGGVQHTQAVAGEVGALYFKGCACFLPAYPTTTPTLVVDMVNPHYPDYYSGRANRAEDNESPIPNYFPAVEAGSSFGFGVLLNRAPDLPELPWADLLRQAKEWLQRAVTRKGAGAKTAAGYGWFELQRKLAPPPEAAAAQCPVVDTAVDPKAPADQLIARFRNLATKDNFPAALPLLAALPGDADLCRAFETLVPANERKRLHKRNPYWQAFTSGKAGADGQRILARLGLRLT